MTKIKFYCLSRAEKGLNTEVLMDSLRFNHNEARHGRGLEGMLKRYFG